MNARQKIRRTSRSTMLRLVAMLALGNGCAADDSSVGDQSTESQVPPPGGRSADDVLDENASDLDWGVDKGLRKDLCCVVQDGDRTKYCFNMTATKAWAATRCNLGNGFDSHVKEGKCSKHKTCEGKRRCTEATPSLGEREVDCDKPPSRESPQDGFPSTTGHL